MFISPSPPICIIGMHRSGTSMVARILNLAGVDLGAPERLLAPQADNPFGFWENRDIMDLNDRLLELQGGTWMKPPVWQDGWEKSSATSVLLEQASLALSRAYTNRQFLKWGWKDPRTTLTVPFWKQVVGALRLVLVVRNPVDVASSLKVRHGWSLEVGIRLWKQYMDAALKHGEGAPMVVTFYDDFFEDPPSEIQRVLGFCGLDFRDAGTDSLRFPGTIRRDQRHHTVGSSGILACNECPHEVRDMYFELRGTRRSIQA